MLFKKQKLDWLVVALFGLGLFLYGSYQSRFRLRPAMPSWQYGYGHPLPADPPPDFTAMQASSMALEDAATRMRYWHRAQHVWYLPTTWQKNYEWNFNWTTDWIQNGGDALHHLFERLGN